MKLKMSPTVIFYLGIFIVGVPFILVDINNDYEEFGEINFPDKPDYFQLSLSIISIVGMVVIRKNLEKKYMVVKR